ncbi:hypothetical protein E9993_16520 [Labilibacter sediminis]|nr:hypothetical protein E9993_16520 [Labilibacter sediminis]
MNHKHIHKSQALGKLHFKQWSNKGYAAFCSMGKVVHIGKLAVSLAQWIGNIIEHVEERLLLCIDRDVDETAEELLEQDMLQAIPVVVNTQKGCGAEVIVNSKNINCR